MNIKGSSTDSKLTPCPRIESWCVDRGGPWAEVHLMNSNRRRIFPFGTLLRGAEFLRKLLLAEVALVGGASFFGFVLAYLLITTGRNGSLPGYGIVVGLLFLAAGTLVVMLVTAVRLSHRVCGPVLKVRRALEQLRLGQDPGHIEIRREDELHDLVEALNGALDEIRRNRRDELQGAPPVGAEVLSMIGEELRSGSETDPPAPIRRQAP